MVINWMGAFFIPNMNLRLNTLRFDWSTLLNFTAWFVSGLLTSQRRLSCRDIYFLWGEFVSCVRKWKPLSVSLMVCLFKNPQYWTFEWSGADKASFHRTAESIIHPMQSEKVSSYSGRPSGGGSVSCVVSGWLLLLFRRLKMRLFISFCRHLLSTVSERDGIELTAVEIKEAQTVLCIYSSTV